MRNYSVLDYPSKQKEYFEFLVIEYDFKLTEEKKADFDFICEYRKPGIRVHLNYDIRDNFFYFTLIKGDNTIFPNDKDNENIRPFFLLFQHFDHNLDPKKLQPNNDQYLESLKANAILLRKYGDRILKGYDWI